MLKNYLIIFLVSVGITVLGYLIDNDKPYAEMSRTLQEGSVLVAIMFAVLAFMFFAIQRLRVAKEEKLP